MFTYARFSQPITYIYIYKFFYEFIVVFLNCCPFSIHFSRKFRGILGARNHNATAFQIQGFSERIYQRANHAEHVNCSMSLMIDRHKQRIFVFFFYYRNETYLCSEYNLYIREKKTNNRMEIFNVVDKEKNQIRK